MGKHQKTLAAIFANPVRSNIKWRTIESLLIRCGCSVSEGDGSRVRFEHELGDATFHRSHPSPDTDKGAVQSVRAYLIQIGVQP